MTSPSANNAELVELIAALREETLSAEQAVRFSGLLADSPSAREIFARRALLQATPELALGPARSQGAADAASSPSSLVSDSPLAPPVIVVRADAGAPSSLFNLHGFVDNDKVVLGASMTADGAVRAFLLTPLVVHAFHPHARAADETLFATGDRFLGVGPRCYQHWMHLGVCGL